VNTAFIVYTLVMAPLLYGTLWFMWTDSLNSRYEEPRIHVETEVTGRITVDTDHQGLVL